MKNIIFIAAPAAGKGTVSKKLVDEYGYLHISTGDLLREVIATGSELGIEIDRIISSGNLVPDDLIFRLIEERIQADDAKNGYILDGFPRNIRQAMGYEEILKRLNKELGIVIELDVPKSILRDRVVGRMLCRECSSIHNILTGEFTPIKEGICNNCGGELYKRGDDNEESFNARYATYLEKTKPLIDYYQDKGCLYKVTGTKAPEVLKSVEVLLND